MEKITCIKKVVAVIEQVAGPGKRTVRRGWPVP